MCQLMEILQITIRARDDKGDELLRTCQLIADQALQENGCTDSWLSQDDSNRDIFILEQQWEHRSALNNYFRSDHFSALIGAMKWLGQSYNIRINESSHEEGMDIVKRVRNI